MNFIGNLVPDFLRFRPIIFLYKSSTLAQIYGLSILFNLWVTVLLIALITSMLSLALRLVIVFSETAESYFPDSKKTGMTIPIGAFLIYLFGTSVSFVGKTLAYFA